MKEKMDAILQNKTNGTSTEGELSILYILYWDHV